MTVAEDDLVTVTVTLADAGTGARTTCGACPHDFADLQASIAPTTRRPGWYIDDDRA